MLRISTADCLILENSQEERFSHDLSSDSKDLDRKGSYVASIFVMNIFLTSCHF